MAVSWLVINQAARAMPASATQASTESKPGTLEFKSADVLPAQRIPNQSKNNFLTVVTFLMLVEHSAVSHSGSRRSHSPRELGLCAHHISMKYCRPRAKPDKKLSNGPCLVSHEIVMPLPETSVP
jgi:hypothetical protein